MNTNLRILQHHVYSVVVYEEQSALLVKTAEGSRVPQTGFVMFLPPDPIFRQRASLRRLTTVLEKKNEPLLLHRIMHETMLSLARRP